LAIFSLVLIFPKILLKFRVPSGITALFIGVLVGAMSSDLQNDQLFRFLAQIGITSLFVFSGLEVNISELKEDRGYLSKYLVKSLSCMALIAVGVNYFLDLSLQNSIILTLGIFTPSAGFIINSLHSFNLGEDHEYWIKSKAISKEVISIILLFIALQSNDIKILLLSLVFYIGLFLFLPTIFKFFFKFVSPHAPNSEVPFLVVISLVCGVISKELGAYYLVGAFIVGLVGSRFKQAIFKENEEIIFTALNNFFNVFLPFYFFYAGMKLSFSDFSMDAITLGAIFLVLFIPLRILVYAFGLKFILKDFVQRPYDISLSLMPTLIFGLVIASVLKERGEVSNTVVYALIFYTLVSSFLPTILFSFQKNNKGDGTPAAPSV
jgi:Kef-type K+ transport system membrane component KefB